MELRHLLYFKTVAEELHFRKAAERLCISQPPLSRQIKELEETLGVILFLRNNKRVSLTAAGKYFKAEVDKIFSSLEETRQKVKIMHGAVNGILRIGYISSTYHIHLGGILKEIHKIYPFVKTKLYEIPTVKQIHALENGKLDIGIMRMPVVTEKLKIKSLYLDSFTAIIPKGNFTSNSLEQLGNYLKGQAFIFFNQDYAPEYFRKLTEICQRLGFVPEIVHEANNIHSIVKLVENGLGVSIVPGSVKEHYHNLNLTFFDLGNLPINSEVVLAYKELNLNPPVELFINKFSGLFYGKS